ncbi:hypothetical protein L3C95_17965 [Chitinophaga filiformis]|uniref:hypothetical protein n=1 Tax=Chitinophaga filiformis TaxID=104663 RepID=UPI001F241966|nr:hypothetical protein [Chitinophaga filiformis]MCF6404790.1 hypothetical protein [Chitinophaga filiformis]
MKDPKVEEKIQALIAQAKATGKTVKIRVPARRRSSLSQIIRTKEQADAFMESLNRAFNRIP